MKNFQYDERDDLYRAVLELHKDKLNEAIGAMTQTCEELIKAGHCIKNISDLDEDSPWYELKNYDWIVYRDAEFYLLIRRYSENLTLYFLNTEKPRYFNAYKSLAFANTCIDLDKVPADEHDYHYENRFESLTPTVEMIIDEYKAERLHCIWTGRGRSADFIASKAIFNGEKIDYLNEFGFCLGELAHVNLCVLADFKFERFCRERMGIKFRIPSYTSDEKWFTEIVEKKGTLMFKGWDSTEKKHFYEELGYIIQWKFEDVYNFLKFVTT